MLEQTPAPPRPVLPFTEQQPTTIYALAASDDAIVEDSTLGKSLRKRRAPRGALASEDGTSGAKFLVRSIEPRFLPQLWGIAAVLHAERSRSGAWKSP